MEHRQNQTGSAGTPTDILEPPAGLPEVIGIGTCCVDLLARVTSLPPSDGAVHLDQYSWQGGGKVPTAIVAAAVLGARCGMVGHIAGDRFGQFCLSDFHRHGIDTTRLIPQADGKTPFAIVVSETDKGTRTFIKTNGKLERMNPEALDTAYFSACRLLHLEHMGALEMAAAAIVRKQGGRVVFDADRYWPGMEQAVPHTDVFIASEAYYRQAFPGGDLRDNLLALKARGPSIVAVTLGDKGCVLLEEDRLIEVPGFSVPVADTTGAGDVFHGAFLFGLLQAWPLVQIARFANAVAAIKCTRMGGRAGIPTLDVAETFLDTGRLDDAQLDARVRHYEDALFAMDACG